MFNSQTYPSEDGLHFSLLTLNPIGTVHLSKWCKIWPHHDGFFQRMLSKNSYCLHNQSPMAVNQCSLIALTWTEIC